MTRLYTEEQKLVKITPFDLKQNPGNPGMQLHHIEKSKDKHFGLPAWAATHDASFKSYACT